MPYTVSLEAYIRLPLASHEERRCTYDDEALKTDNTHLLYRMKTMTTKTVAKMPTEANSNGKKTQGERQSSGSASRSRHRSLTGPGT